jgi:predicted regulator of Ras-like GTPase activity (Roadblock/LC7/MglB family)
MDAILQGLLDLPGVNAALVLDAASHLAGYRGKSIYDRALCEQVGATLGKAIDSIQLQQEDWETVSAQFTDGKLLLRSLGKAAGGAHVLAVVADSTLNASFATVALRVAANKLRKALEGGPATPVPAPTAPPSAGHGAVVPPPLPASASQAVASSTGMSWTKPGSTVALTGITVRDPAAAAFLARCTKALARAVGPMAKVYVQEAVRRLSADATYTMSLEAQLVEDLAGQVEDAAERAQFLTAVAGK